MIGRFWRWLVQRGRPHAQPSEDDKQRLTVHVEALERQLRVIEAKQVAAAKGGH